METPAATLDRLTSLKPVPCNAFASEGESHHLHKITWIKQVVLDALVQDFIAAAAAHQLSPEAKQAFTAQVIAMATVQASLRKGVEADAALVFPSLEEGAATLRKKPQELWDAFELYTKSFELTDTEKKS